MHISNTNLQNDLMAAAVEDFYDLEDSNEI
jgi:hypothetical protein